MSLIKKPTIDKRTGSVVAGEKLDYLVIGGTGNVTTPETIYVRTRRGKCQLNIALEDFSRIHGQFSEKTHPQAIETTTVALAENEKIKFQIRLVPGKHDLHFDAVYRGSEQSANLLIDAFLLDKDGRRFPFEFGRKIDVQISSRYTESLNNFVYDRDELERKRDRLFVDDKLVLCFDVNVTWCETNDQPQFTQ